jgi:stearoyl-CoA desaturase (Delta-9 desaturase)
MINLANFNWKSGIFLIAYQVILLAVLPWYFLNYTVTPSILTLTIVFLFLGSLSITAGYHRLFSHKTYKTVPFIENIILFFASSTIQGSALRWCNDHRNHHAFVDTDKDPYTITKGFWYAHFLWMLEKQNPINPKVVPDLMRNKRVMWQDRYDVACMFGSNIIIFLFTAWVTGEYLSAFVLTVWLRLFVQHHTTWFINSLAHTWGSQPFCKEHTAVNNFLISFLTCGEGYHNYHHTFANDYRNGVHWYQFDPTKWVIWGLNKCSLTWGLRRVDIHTIEKKIVLEGKDMLLQQLTQLCYVKKEELEIKIQEISDRLVKESSKFKELRENYYQMRKDKADNDTLARLKKEMKSIKIGLRADWKEWTKLSRNIMHLKPSAA